MQRTHGNMSLALWVVHLALFFVLGRDAAAADHKVQTAAGTLVVPVDVNWTPITDMPPEMEGAVGFRVGDGSFMQWLFVPGNAAPPGTGDKGNLRILTMQLKRELEQQNAEMPDELLVIDGNVKGYYIFATDPKPKPGEWKFMYTGWIAIGDFPVMFNIVWNQGGKTSADRALASVKSMRISAR